MGSWGCSSRSLALTAVCRATASPAPPAASMPNADSITFRPREGPDFEDKDTACKSLAQHLPRPHPPTWGSEWAPTSSAQPPSTSHRPQSARGPPSAASLSAADSSATARLCRAGEECSRSMNRETGLRDQECGSRPRSPAAS